MLTLYILRHAKAAAATSGGGDVDRALSDRGAAEMAALGQRLAALDVAPQLVLCSSARRAQETFAAIQPFLGGDPPIEVEDAIYHAGPQDLLVRLRAAGDVERVMIVGHNPTIEVLTATLASDGTPGTVQAAMNFRAGSLAELEFTVDAWCDLQPGSGRLIRFLEPEG